MSGFVQSDGKEFSILNKLAIKLLQLYFSESYKDKIIAETAIQKSSLDWVIVRAAALAQNQPTGQYKAGIKTKVPPLMPCRMPTVRSVCSMPLKKIAGQDKLLMSVKVKKPILFIKYTTKFIKVLKCFVIIFLALH